MQWPASLPQDFLVDSFSEGVEGGIRTDMDVGPAFQRPRSRSQRRTVSGAVMVDRDQFETLRQFWVDDLAMGSVAFDWADPISGQPARVQFDNTKPPQASAQTGLHFRVPLTLTVLNITG